MGRVYVQGPTSNQIGCSTRRAGREAGLMGRGRNQLRAFPYGSKTTVRAYAIGFDGWDRMGQYGRVDWGGVDQRRNGSPLWNERSQKSVTGRLDLRLN